jgi:hypothetical protein
LLLLLPLLMPLLLLLLLLVPPLDVACRLFSAGKSGKPRCADAATL